MAAARDQAARIVRAEPDTAERRFRARRCPRLSPTRFVRILRMRPSRAAPPKSPERPAIAETPAAKPPAAAARRRRRAETGQTQIGSDRHRRAARARRRGLWRHYFLVGRFYVSTDDAYVRANNTTLGARVSGHIAAILPGDNARGPHRRRDLQDRRRRLSHRGGCRAHQDRDPAGHHRSHRPPGQRAWKARSSRPKRSLLPRRPA